MISEYKKTDASKILYIINDASLPQNTIGITVDDAYRSFLDVAWPRLKKLGFPVVLFVTTNTISSNNKNYLNIDQLKKLIQKTL